MARPITFVLALSLLAAAGPAAVAGTPTSTTPGLVVVESAHDVGTTTDRLVSAARAKGLTIFARIDHAAGAEAAGLALPPTEVVIFGTAKVGTPLMQCDRHSAIDLPLRALIWQDDGGQVRLAYNSVEWLAARYDLGDCAPVLAKVDKALASLAAAATNAQ